MPPTLKAVASSAPSRSPERKALALAIDNKRIADAQLDAQRSAVERAERLVEAARERMQDAEAAVVTVKDQHARAMAAALGKGAPVPANRLTEFRNAASEVADELDAARAALEQLSAALADGEAKADEAALGVDAAIIGVLATAAPELVAAAEAHRDELLSLLSILFFIRRRGSSRHGTSGTWSENPTLSHPLVATPWRVEGDGTLSRELTAIDADDAGDAQAA
jgi:hypothetical protein